VQRPLGHHQALTSQQDPDLHHRHISFNLRGDVLTARLQLRPPHAVPVRPDRPDHRHHLTDQLLSELLLPALTRQARTP
jgi:hypothetical protein